MAKIIVAFPDKQINRNITDMLEHAGLEVFRTCMTGNEVMRAFNQCQDGILITAVRFPDRTSDAIAYDLGSRALILVLGRAEQLALVEHPEVFHLKLPASAAEITASVNMLLQLHYKRMPHRSVQDKEDVTEAKQLLMDDYALTEPDAHRLMQKISMRLGMRMQETAKKILEGNLSMDIYLKDLK